MCGVLHRIVPLLQSEASTAASHSQTAFLLLCMARNRLPPPARSVMLPALAIGCTLIAKLRWLIAAAKTPHPLHLYPPTYKT